MESSTVTVGVCNGRTSVWQALVLGALAAGLLAAQEPPREDQPAPYCQGSFSCAAAACHGSPDPDRSRGPGARIRRDELLIWVSRDPHAKAHRTLSDAASRRIFRNLGVDPDQGGPQFQQWYRLCMECHGVRYRPRRGEGRWLEEGVGCEACHGPSSRWADEHFRPEFQRLDAAQKETLGFYPTDSLWRRGQLCARCHVGSGQAAVNHDLIAAGHPALRFELASFFARLPAHWKWEREVQQQGGPGDYWQRTWATGQNATALMAARLMAHQARDQTAPWPELAQMDCLACHHPIQPPGDDWRRARLDPASGPVTIPWNPWPFAAWEPSAREGAMVLADLKGALQQHIIPDRMEVAQAAERLAELLAHSGTATGPADASAGELARRWAQFMSPSRGEDLVASWETAVQAYLYLYAVQLDRRMGPDGPTRPADPTVRRLSAELQQLLGLGEGADVPPGGPPAFHGTVPPSPGASSQRAEILRKLRELYGALHAQDGNR